MTMTMSTPGGAISKPGRILDVGVDLDGVCYDYVDTLRLWLCKATGRTPESYPPQTTWTFFADDWGMTLEEYLQANHDATDAEFLFRTGTPFPGVVEGLGRLITAGHRVHVITDRASWGTPGVAETSTRLWLSEEQLPHTSLTMSKDKTVVHTDVFIEDRPENYLALRAAGVDVFLRDHTYNRHVDTPPGRRVASFSEFVDAVEVLAAA